MQQYEHTGTVFGTINKVQFEGLPVIEPMLEAVVAFETCVLYLDKRIGLVVGESLDLAAQRDALL